MQSVLLDFDGVEIFFMVCAAVGGTFVLIRLVMQFMGLDHHFSHSDGADMSFDADHPDTDAGFKVLSIHSITSFFMMFGLVGLAMYRQSQMGVVLSMLAAILAGAGSVWVIGKLFSLTARLQSSGNIQIDTAVGAQGRVYLTIPPDGTGIVCVKVSDRLRDYEARSHDATEIVTDTPIHVLWVEGNTLVVQKL